MILCLYLIGFCITLIPLSILIYVISYWSWWPSFIWYKYTYNSLYIPSNLAGWYDIQDLWYFWYTQPISYTEFMVRVRMSEWVASRADRSNNYHFRHLYPSENWGNRSWKKVGIWQAKIWNYWANKMFHKSLGTL